jgi:hypothetical protein
MMGVNHRIEKKLCHEIMPLGGESDRKGQYRLKKGNGSSPPGSAQGPIHLT